MAGPLTNLLLAALAIAGLGLWVRFGTIDMSNHVVENAWVLLMSCAQLNVVLFLFNLIPVPPLDGSRVFANLIPAYRRLMYDPTMAGIFMALSFAAIIIAGRFIWPYVVTLLDSYVQWCLRLRFDVILQQAAGQA
jgi:Zn-dependent protease